MTSMSDSNIDALLAECRSGVPARQFLAIEQLLEHEPSLVGPALLDLLADPEALVRSEAVDALGILAYAPAVPQVRAVLANDPEPLVRASAAETLGDLGDPQAIPDLVRALNDPDAAVRGFGANSVGLLGASSELHDLAARIAVEQLPQVQAELHGARYRLGEASALDHLLELLDGGDEDLGTNVLNVLRDLSERKVPPGLRADATRIRAMLASVASRWPLLAADAQKVIANLGPLSAE